MNFTITVNGQYVYRAEETDRNKKAYDVHLRKAINDAGSLSFTISSTHPLYNSITILGSTVVVTVNTAGGRSHIIWAGRPISIHTDFYLGQTYECEGGLAYLGDIYARPHLWYDTVSTQEKTGETTTSQNGTVNDVYETVTTYVERSATPSEYLTWLFEEYTKRCSTNRYIAAPYVDILNLFNTKRLVGEEIRCVKGNDDYKTVLDCFNELVGQDENAIVIWQCTDYNSSGNISVYLSIFNIVTWGGFGKAATLSLNGNTEQRANLISTENDIDANDIFTSIIPLAKDKQTLNSTTDPDDEEEQPLDGKDYIDGTQTTLYGVIEKTMNFDDIDIWKPYEPDPTEHPGVIEYQRDTSELGERAMQELLKNQSKVSEITVQAVDLSMIDPKQGFIDIGNTVDVVDEVHIIMNGEYLVIGMDLELDHPDASTYTLYPKGYGYQMGSSKSLSKILSRQTVKEENYAQEEMPSSIIQVNDKHVMAKYQKWTEHYTINESDNHLVIYRTPNDTG